MNKTVVLGLVLNAGLAGAGAGLARTAAAQPAPFPGLPPSAQGAPPVAGPTSVRPADEPPRCHSGLYLEPTLAMGGTRTTTVTRIRGALGFRHAQCTEGYNLRLGAFIEGGDEALGDAFQAGPEVEYNDLLGSSGWRGGARVAVGVGNVVTIAGGPRLRRGPFTLGADLVYSSRGGDGQPAAIGGLGTLGVTGKAAGVVVGIAAILAVLAVASFNTT